MVVYAWRSGWMASNAVLAAHLSTELGHVGQRAKDAAGWFLEQHIAASPSACTCGPLHTLTCIAYRLARVRRMRLKTAALWPSAATTQLVCGGECPVAEGGNKHHNRIHEALSKVSCNFMLG
jgi:hypothetical protein